MPQSQEPHPAEHVKLRLLVARVTPGDLLVGTALLMLLSFSLADGWVHPIYADGASATLGSMWSGIGIIAGLCLAWAILYWAALTFLTDLLHIPEPRIPAAVFWFLFGGFEALLIVVLHLTQRLENWSHGVHGGFVLAVAPSIKPGWAWYGGMVSAILISLGGSLKSRERPRKPDLPPAQEPVPPAPEPAPPAAAPRDRGTPRW